MAVDVEKKKCRKCPEHPTPLIQYPSPPPLGNVMPGMGGSANQRPLREALAASSQTGTQAGREWARQVLSDGGHMVWPAPESSEITIVASKLVLQLGVKYHQLIMLLGLNKGWPHD